MSELRERHAELSEMKSLEAAMLLSEINQALVKPTGNELELVKRADFLVESEMNVMAAEERRRAVLEGLASLGYEVSEGMATAWVEGGRVVLERPLVPVMESNFLAARSLICFRCGPCASEIRGKRVT
jgi:hypothetical protein